MITEFIDQQGAIVRLKPWLASVLLVLGLCGFAPSPASPPRMTLVEPAAKLGFDYLSKAQYQDLWKRADSYALAEAFLRQCDKPSFVERRMWLAAKDCVQEQALRKVSLYFRSKVARLATEKKFECGTDVAKKLVKTVRSRIDNDVAEVRAMCKACFFCG